MVQTIVLDREFPDLRVDVVKMDIEGAEGFRIERDDGVDRPLA